MSRAQQGDVNATAAAQNSSYNADADKSFDKTEGDIASYGDAVGAFGAANPYVNGGAVQTADSQQFADTAAGQAEQAGQAIQGQAVRTGQNAGGAIAATEHMQQQNERNLVGQTAAANKDRAAADASYRGAVVGDTGNVASLQDQLAVQQGNLAQGALNTQEQSAQTPSFLDTLGNGLTGLGSTLGSAAIKACWIAAELYGGWDDPRVSLVRYWIFNDFAQTWYGRMLCRMYLLWGEQVAKAIQTRRRLRRMFQWIFDKALRAAEVQHGQR